MASWVVAGSSSLRGSGLQWGIVVAGCSAAVPLCMAHRSSAELRGGFADSWILRWFRLHLCSTCRLQLSCFGLHCSSTASCHCIVVATVFCRCAFIVCPYSWVVADSLTLRGFGLQWGAVVQVVLPLCPVAWLVASWVVADSSTLRGFRLHWGAVAQVALPLCPVAWLVASWVVAGSSTLKGFGLQWGIVVAGCSAAVPLCMAHRSSAEWRSGFADSWTLRCFRPHWCSTCRLTLS